MEMYFSPNRLKEEKTHGIELKMNKCVVLKIWWIKEKRRQLPQSNYRVVFFAGSCPEKFKCKIQWSKPTQWFPFLTTTIPEPEQVAKQIQVRGPAIDKNLFVDYNLHRKCSDPHLWWCLLPDPPLLRLPARGEN